MTYSSKNVNPNELFSVNKILNLEKLLILDSCKFAYAHYKGILPKNLNNLLKFKYLAHSHHTRLADNGYDTPYKTPYNLNSYAAAFNWNKYCIDLVGINNKSLFFKKVKLKLFKEMLD